MIQVPAARQVFGKGNHSHDVPGQQPSEPAQVATGSGDVTTQVLRRLGGGGGVHFEQQMG